MSTYRYARDSRTSAQRAARQWQRDVDETQQILGMYANQVSEGRKLSNYDAMRLRNAERKLAKLMAENPNEPV